MSDLSASISSHEGGGVMQIMSNRESEALLKAQKAKAIKECKEQMEAFVACTKPRTISMAWACKEQSRALRECLRIYTSEEALEAEKRTYMSTTRGSGQAKY